MAQYIAGQGNSYMNQIMYGGGGYGDGGGGNAPSRAGGDSYGGNYDYNMRAPSPNAPVNEGGPGNPNGASNMPKPQYTRPVFGTGGLENNKGPAPLGPQDYPNQRPAYRGYDGGGINPGGMYSGQPQFNPMNTRMGGGFGSNLGTPNGMPPTSRDALRASLGVRQPGPVQPNFGNQVQGFDPYSQYGNAGQSQQLGRYVPPMMRNSSDPSGGWLGGGGYSYNIPNSYGSGQWNQFNSRDVAFPQFGQSQNNQNQNMRPQQPMPNPIGAPGSTWPPQGNFSNNAGGMPVTPTYGPQAFGVPGGTPFSPSSTPQNPQ